MLQQAPELHTGTRPVATPAQPLRTIVVRDEAGFCALREEWNAVAAQVDPPSPVHSWEWRHSWWRHLGPQGAARRRCTLEIVTFRRGGCLLGVAPFYRRRLTRFGPSVLLPLGWEPGRGWSISEQLELILPAAQRPELLQQLTGWLQRCGAAAAVLPGMHDGDPLPAWIESHLATRGARTTFLHRPLPERWDDFVAGLNKSMRDNVRYYPRLLQRHGHHAEFRVATTPAEVRAALPVFYRLHAARADAPMRVEHRDAFATPQRRRFLDEVAPALAAGGRLRLGLLHVDGSPVAAQLWLQQDRVMFVYYSGFDPAWARYSVALVATLEAMRHGHAGGVRHVEFLAGRGQFKERWDPLARGRRNLTVAAHPRPLRALLAATAVRSHLRRLT